MAVLDLQGMTIRPQQEAWPSVHSLICVPSNLSLLLCE
jgi:SapB morphogen precursor RamS